MKKIRVKIFLSVSVCYTVVVVVVIIVVSSIILWAINVNLQKPLYFYDYTKIPNRRDAVFIVAE